MVSKYYHKFLNVFSKRNLNKVLPYLKYNHKIELLNRGKNHSQIVFCGMSKLQLEFMKQFLEENPKKSFIETNRAPCSLLILLAKKPSGDIRFCIDYKKLNKLTKKDAYLILLIAKTLAQLKNAKIFIKIDIWQAFHKLRIATSSKNLTTIATQFDAFKWKVLSFGLTGGLVL